MSKKCKDILIVEDQEFFQDILEIALKDIIPEGGRIRKVDSGNNAIDFLIKESDSVGLILLDMKMSDGDGITVLNYLEQNALYNIPIYIVSSLDSEFISFVMQSIGDLEIRLVGFVPKDTPDLVIGRIKDIESDIQTFLLETKSKERESVVSVNEYLGSIDIIQKLESDLILYIQPKIALQNGGFISGYEVLSRLCDETFGIIEPDVFLECLDTLEKKSAFNWLTIDKVLKAHRANIDMGFYSSWSINVDPDVLSQSNFVDKFESLLKVHNTDATLLRFEITEVAQSDHRQLYFNVARLKLLGATISLDDFGKGYSNLDRLDKIPFDEVKFDMHLISKIFCSEKEKNLVVSMFNYLTEKGCNVVAEGVEDKETNDFLVSVGFTEAQGYYYSMPRPISEIDSIFVQFFKNRVTTLLGDMSSDSFLEIYNYFHVSILQTIDAYINDDSKVSISDFSHQIKGTLKTAGLYEAVDFIEQYKKTENKNYIIKLREYLVFFNTVLLTKIVSS